MEALSMVDAVERAYFGADPDMPATPVTTESMLAGLAADIVEKERALASDKAARDTLIRLLDQQGRSLRCIAKVAGLRSADTVRKILAKPPE